MQFIFIISSFHYSTLVEVTLLERTGGMNGNIDEPSDIIKEYIIKYQRNNEKLGWN